MSSTANRDAQLSTFRHFVRSGTILAESLTMYGASEAAFSVTLECEVTRILRAGGRRQPVRMPYPGKDANVTFTVNEAVLVPSNEDGVREFLRGLMRRVPPLQDLALSDRQWEDILPQSAVPRLTALARRPARRAASPKRRFGSRSTKKWSSSCPRRS